MATTVNVFVDDAPPNINSIGSAAVLHLSVTLTRQFHGKVPLTDQLGGDIEMTNLLADVFAGRRLNVSGRRKRNMFATLRVRYLTCLPILEVLVVCYVLFEVKSIKVTLYYSNSSSEVIG